MKKKITLPRTRKQLANFLVLRAACGDARRRLAGMSPTEAWQAAFASDISWWLTRVLRLKGTRVNRILSLSEARADELAVLDGRDYATEEEIANQMRALVTYRGRRPLTIRRKKAA